jgi:hypothetical protein
VELRSDDPVPVLIDLSRAARLVVLGSRGLGGFSGLLAGSTAVALVTYGSCPVAVIRGRTPDEPAPCEGPVVVGVDGSPASDAAIAMLLSRHHFAVLTWWPCIPGWIYPPIFSRHTLTIYAVTGQNRAEERGAAGNGCRDGSAGEVPGSVRRVGRSSSRSDCRTPPCIRDDFSGGAAVFELRLQQTLTTSTDTRSASQTLRDSRVVHQGLASSAATCLDDQGFPTLPGERAKHVGMTGPTARPPRTPRRDIQHTNMLGASSDLPG